ncbi:MAG: hypothetical protein ACLP1X_08585, partial [Polyangiaceae bacterium]
PSPKGWGQGGNDLPPVLEGLPRRGNALGQSMNLASRSPDVVGSVLGGGRGPASAGSAGSSSWAGAAGRDLPHPPPALRPDDGGLGRLSAMGVGVGGVFP